MKKTINKIIKLFSCGLLLFAVTNAYAQSAQQALYQDAWTFMEKNTKDKGAAFKERYGKEAGRAVNIINCGEKKCNLNFRVCLERKTSPFKKDFICTTKDEAESFKKGGYTESSGGYGSLKNFAKDHQIKTLGKDCYEANNNGNANQQTKVYCAKETGDRVEIKAGESGIGTCEVVEVSWYNSRNCIFCPMIGVIYAVADKITSVAHLTFARSFAIVIAVGLTIWIALKTLTFVSSLTKQDIAKYLTELLVQSFKFMIAFFALLYYDEIFSMLILPLIRSGMEFGASFVLVDDFSSRFGNEVSQALIAAGTTGDGSAIANMGDKVPLHYSRNANNKFFDVYTYATIENLAHNVNLQYSLLQTIGGSLVCTGFKLMFGLFENESGGFGLGFACIIYGLCFGIFGFLLSLAFVFYLLDAVVQLGIVGGLLPFLVASWPFKLTSKYTKTGFNMLLNSVFVFMLMGVVVNLSMELIKAAVEFNTDGGSGDVTETGLSGLIKALSEIDTKKLGVLVNVISIGFILFFVANIMAMMLLQKVSSFAGQFASGTDLGISSDVARRAGSAVGEAGKKVVSSASKGFKEGFSESTQESKDNVKGMLSSAKEKVTNRVNNGIRNVAKRTAVGRAILGAQAKYQRGKIHNENLLKQAQKNQQLANQQSLANIMGTSGQTTTSGGANGSSGENQGAPTNGTGN